MTDTAAASTRTWRLGAEFAALYLAAPLVMALVLPPDALFPALFAVMALGLVLLHVTPGFDWSDLTAGAGRISWRLTLGFTVATILVAGTVVALTIPQAALFLVREEPVLMLMITLLYPFLSALPQEVVYRPLFFRRYGVLLPPGAGAQVVLNAAIFSFAHLMYWSWIVAAMTFSGGLAFAYAYRVRRNFPEAVILHALSGIVVFAAGLGVFFYSGNIARPF